MMQANRSNNRLRERIHREREGLRRHVEDLLELPMLVLSVVWLALLGIELIWGLSPTLEAAGAVIWLVFVAEFALRLLLAAHKRDYLRANWLSAISLLIPAVRAVRVVRLARVLRATRATRVFRLARVLTSLNRGVGVLRTSMKRRGFGYVAAATGVVAVLGAAGMYTFEREIPDGLNSYGRALWWTGMLLTTMGSDYWPQTAEGRILSLLLALYAFAAFGYVTAFLAASLVGGDAATSRGKDAAKDSLEALRDEIRILRVELRAATLRPGAGPSGSERTP